MLLQHGHIRALQIVIIIIKQIKLTAYRILFILCPTLAEGEGGASRTQGEDCLVGHLVSRQLRRKKAMHFNH